MTEKSMSVGLSSWIIQDGNYIDFRKGTNVAFALELHIASAMNKAEAVAKPQLTYIAGPEYKALGRIIHIAAEWWAIDFGVPAFHEERPPQNMNVGEWVQADIYLGIDPFFYFERLASMPNAPALIADWQVDRIQIQTAPFIQQGNVMVRDEALSGWRDIDVTNAWQDDGGHAEYVLTCRKLQQPLRHSRS